MKESQHIEWKQNWRDEYLRWVCGFANAQGGRLMIGKNDRGVVVGLPDAKKLLDDIPNKVRDILGIMVEVNLHTEHGKDWLEIVVEPYPSPISYKGEYHYRSGSTKQELKGAALHRFMMRKQGRNWDDAPVPYVSAADLDERALTYFRKRALRSERVPAELLEETDGVLLDKLHLKDGDYLKRAAVLLFHPDPERFFTGAYVKVGYFRTNADLLYHDEIHGDLFTQLNQTVDVLLAKYLRARITYEGLQRVERYPVPKEALREALLNALAHKDYGSRVPIQISVYDDKLMLWNNGELHEGWTLATLLGKHSSQPYNPDVANAFFRAGMIELWGRGIEHIVDACHAEGAPTPEFRFEHGGLWVVFPYPADNVMGNGPSQVTGQVGENVGENVGESAVKMSVKILQLLAANPSMRLAEVAAEVGKSVRTIERASAMLVKAGRLKHVGPQKGGHWEVIGGEHE